MTRRSLPCPKRVGFIVVMPACLLLSVPHRRRHVGSNQVLWRANSQNRPSSAALRQLEHDMGQSSVRAMVAVQALVNASTRSCVQEKSVDSGHERSEKALRAVGPRSQCPRKMPQNDLRAGCGHLRASVDSMNLSSKLCSSPSDLLSETTALCRAAVSTLSSAKP